MLWQVFLERTTLSRDLEQGPSHLHSPFCSALRRDRQDWFLHSPNLLEDWVTSKLEACLWRCLGLFSRDIPSSRNHTPINSKMIIMKQRIRCVIGESWPIPLLKPSKQTNGGLCNGGGSACPVKRVRSGWGETGKRYESQLIGKGLQPLLRQWPPPLSSSAWLIHVWLSLTG